MFNKLRLLATLLLLTSNLFAQTVSPSNKPVATTQVPAATGTIAPTPGAYTLPSGSQNFIRSWEALGPVTDAASMVNLPYTAVRQTTQYFDGLGRPLQTVMRQASPTGVDIVQPVVYDAFGREAVKYLPYAGGNDGLFKADPFNAQKTFYEGPYTAEQPAYQGEQALYSRMEFEASPLNRVLKAFAPGNSWAGTYGVANAGGFGGLIGGGADHSVKTRYQANIASEFVCIWNIGNQPFLFNAANDDNNNLPSSTSYYAPGTLYKTTTIDEANNSVVEYKDKEGRVILKKVAITKYPSASHCGWLCTYYVYDDFGMLRFVIPPKAVEAMRITANWSIGAVKDLCFRYEYDERLRMQAKKVPDAGWVYMLYDLRDRLAFTQDANQRPGNQWLASMYDELNRPVQTAMLYGGTFSTLKNHLGAQSDFSVAANTIPTSLSYQLLSITYYDNYTWLGPNEKRFINHSTRMNEEDGGNAYPEAWPATSHTQLRGLVTGTKVLTLPNPNNLASGSWLTTATYYDDQYRPIQTQSDNHRGGVDIVSTRYDFTGKPIVVYQITDNPAAGVMSGLAVKSVSKYDHGGRLITVTKKLYQQQGDASPAETRQLVKNEYDALGQLKKKSIGQKRNSDGSLSSSVALEDQVYQYNIRGWLKSINGDYAAAGSGKWFGMELSYDWGYAQNQYTGNIAGMRWRSGGDGMRRSYGYGYDIANRLLYADFSQKDAGVYADNTKLNFDVIMGDGTANGSAYDANGNIQSMTHWGMVFGTGGVQSKAIDELKYTYYNNSNRLQSVYDAKNDEATTLGDFRFKSSHPQYGLKNSLTTYNQVTDYGYDANGNLKKDLNKGIGTATTDAIEYNYLNLPAKITVQGKGTIEYLYTATGAKLRKTVNETGKPAKITDYIAGAVYENDALQFLGHEEGRIRYIPPTENPTNALVFDYFLKDHLGNVRVMLTDELKVNSYPAATLEAIGDLDPVEVAVDYERNNYFDINTANVVDNPQTNGIPAYNNNNGFDYNHGELNSTQRMSTQSQKVYKLNSAVSKTGLGTTLKVMAGDKLDIFGLSYYNTSSGSGGYVLVNDLLSSFVGGAGSAVGGKVSPAQAQAINPVGSALYSFVQNRPTASSPKAYINYIFFDEQFTFVSGGYSRVGNSGDLKQHYGELQQIPVPKNGYVYVYCSNETDANVFFDNLQVVHTPGPLLEETHYYPFGLTMAGISNKAANSLGNRYKFNSGTELNADLDLNWYETRHRGYDPQLGRFSQADPWAEVTCENSQFVFANNNPLTFNDPLGLTAGFANDSLGRANDLGNVTVTAQRKVPNAFLPYINFPNGRPGVIASYKDWPISFSRDRSNDMLDSWAMGLGAENRIYLQDHPMTKRMMNAYRVSRAKAFFYKKYISDYKKGQPLKNASVSGYKGVFGFTEFVLAGGDVVEQFVGSFDLDIQMDEKGENVLFIMKNTTSNTSALYHMADSHDRDSNLQFDARGNLNQIYIWKEPLNKVMGDGLINSIGENSHVVK
ncbi:MAG TPA: DUF6443 domain-containing protein [Phnomibacter sp.]|nr:DUF6443 domain-containing protein [Phnomibacter sp.]